MKFRPFCIMTIITITFIFGHRFSQAIPCFVPLCYIYLVDQICFFLFCLIIIRHNIFIMFMIFLNICYSILLDFDFTAALTWKKLNIKFPNVLNVLSSGLKKITGGSNSFTVVYDLAYISWKSN